MKLTVIITEENRKYLAEKVKESILSADTGDVVKISPATRNLEQNAKFHAICSDIARQAKFASKQLGINEWKVLLVSGHAIATGQGANVLPGLEGEFVNIRESTASMSVKRLSSLIEYALAWGSQNGVQFTY